MPAAEEFNKTMEKKHSRMEQHQQSDDDVDGGYIPEDSGADEDSEDEDSEDEADDDDSEDEDSEEDRPKSKETRRRSTKKEVTYTEQDENQIEETFDLLFVAGMGESEQPVAWLAIPQKPSGAGTVVSLPEVQECGIIVDWLEEITSEKGQRMFREALVNPEGVVTPDQVLHRVVNQEFKRDEARLLVMKDPEKKEWDKANAALKLWRNEEDPEDSEVVEHEPDNVALDVVEVKIGRFVVYVSEDNEGGNGPHISVGKVIKVNTETAEFLCNERVCTKDQYSYKCVDGKWNGKGGRGKQKWIPNANLLLCITKINKDNRLSATSMKELQEKMNKKGQLPDAFKNFDI